MRRCARCQSFLGACFSPIRLCLRGSNLFLQGTLQCSTIFPGARGSSARVPRTKKKLLRYTAPKIAFGPSVPRHPKAGFPKAKEDQAEQCKAMQSNAKRAGLGRAGPGRAGLGRAGLGRAGPGQAQLPLVPPSSPLVPPWAGPGRARGY